MSVTPEPPRADTRVNPWTTRVTATDLAPVVGDAARLAAVRETRMLDTPAAPAVGRIVRLAARLLRAPTAVLTIVDGDRDVIKAHVGLPEPVAAAGEIRAFPSFCQLGIARHHAMHPLRARDGAAAGRDAAPGAGPGAGALLVVGDARDDAVFGDAFAAVPSVAGGGLRACVTAPLLDGAGRGVGSLCVIDFETRAWTDDEIATLEDLASAAAGEIALHATVHRLREVAAEAEDARAQAEAANQAKSQFLAVMSHELRTPLNAIGGYAELIELGIRGPVTPEQAGDLSRIQASKRHLLSLINDLLNFARLEAGQVEVRREAVDVRAALADAEALVAPQVAARGLSLAVAAPLAPLVAVADVEKLRQVLLNLLTNALKFTDAGGAITLSAEPGEGPGEGVVRFVVRDTGRGIAPDQLERVFEPFVQVDRHLTPQAQQGVGLGLAISRELARAMGGDLAAESRLGAGSRFTLTVPRAPSDAPLDAPLDA